MSWWDDEIDDGYIDITDDTPNEDELERAARTHHGGVTLDELEAYGCFIDPDLVYESIDEFDLCDEYIQEYA